MKQDDSSLEPEQFATVLASARSLLDRGDAWGVLPTPVDVLMEAAQLKVATISAFDERSVLRYIREVGQNAERLLRRALDKVLGIFDVHADVVHVDPTVSEGKQTFLKLHEAGHKELPHQRGLYRWIQDSAKHLDPSVAELFEREANSFARLVLFQHNGFAERTADEPFSIRVPMNGSKLFGASLYASFREYVRTHHKNCAVVVLNPTKTCPTRGAIAEVRRIEMSESFQKVMGFLPLPTELTRFDDLMRFVPLGSRRMSRPSSFELIDRNGNRCEFVGEGFKTPYQTFILIHCVGTLGQLISFTSLNSGVT